MTTDFATKPIEIHPEFADIIRQQTVRYESPSQSPLPRLINGKFDRLVLQSGLDVSPPGWLMLCVATGVVAGGVAALLTESLIASGLFAVLGIFIPIAALNHVREQRQSLLLDQMPDAIDRLGRLAQTGRNLASSFEHAAVDTPQPLGRELAWIGEQLTGGSELDQTLAMFTGRTGLPATSMMAGVLKNHMAMGTEVAEPLFDLADNVRDQLVQRERERAIAMEGQWPAMVVVMLPFIVSLIFLFNETAALNRVLESVVGRVVLCGAAVAWCLGSIVVLRIVRQVSR